MTEIERAVRTGESEPPVNVERTTDMLLGEGERQKVPESLPHSAPALDRDRSQWLLSRDPSGAIA